MPEDAPASQGVPLRRASCADFPFTRIRVTHRKTHWQAVFWEAQAKVGIAPPQTRTLDPEPFTLNLNHVVLDFTGLSGSPISWFPHPLSNRQIMCALTKGPHPNPKVPIAVTKAHTHHVQCHLSLLRPEHGLFQAIMP